MTHFMILDDVIQITLQNGGGWAIAHAQRLLVLIQEIGQNLPYNKSIVSLAAYLHDWGAFPAYKQKNVEHGVRSRQVAEEKILPFIKLEPAEKTIILEAIELHDYRDLRPTTSNEGLLLREADMLEFLGMIGIGREFARGPNDMGLCYRRVLERRDGIQGRFTLPEAQNIAQTRLAHMDQCFSWLEEESYGIL